MHYHIPEQCRERDFDEFDHDSYHWIGPGVRAVLHRGKVQQAPERVIYESANAVGGSRWEK